MPTFRSPLALLRMLLQGQPLLALIAAVSLLVGAGCGAPPAPNVPPAANPPVEGPGAAPDAGMDEDGDGDDGDDEEDGDGDGDSDDDNDGNDGDND